MTYRQTADGRTDRQTCGQTADGRTTKAIACRNFRLAIWFYWLPCKKCVQTFFALCSADATPNAIRETASSVPHTHTHPPDPLQTKLGGLKQQQFSNALTTIGQTWESSAVCATFCGVINWEMQRKYEEQFSECISLGYCRKFDWRESMRYYREYLIKCI